VLPALMVAVLACVGGCSSQMALADPPPPDTHTPAATPALSVDALRPLVGPQTRMIVGATASVVLDTPDGALRFFVADPATTAATAAEVGIPVCSIELDTVQTPPMPDDVVSMSVMSAVQACANDQLAAMLAKLRQLQTPTTVVIVAANAAATVHSTNNGINYFYDGDILRMLHAARQLNVVACVVAPSDLALPTLPAGQTPGLSIDQALASCGR
jgi:hypothetical protein